MLLTCAFSWHIYFLSYWLMNKYVGLLQDITKKTKMCYFAFRGPFFALLALKQTLQSHLNMLLNSPSLFLFKMIRKCQIHSDKWWHFREKYANCDQLSYVRKFGRNYWNNLKLILKNCCGQIETIIFTISQTSCKIDIF